MLKSMLPEYFVFRLAYLVGVQLAFRSENLSALTSETV